MRKQARPCDGLSTFTPGRLLRKPTVYALSGLGYLSRKCVLLAHSSMSGFAGLHEVTIPLCRGPTRAYVLTGMSLIPNRGMLRGY